MPNGSRHAPENRIIVEGDLIPLLKQTKWQELPGQSLRQYCVKPIEQKIRDPLVRDLPLHQGGVVAKAQPSRFS